MMVYNDCLLPKTQDKWYPFYFPYDSSWVSQESLPQFRDICKTQNLGISMCKRKQLKKKKFASLQM